MENCDCGRAYSEKHGFKQPDGTEIHVTQRNECKIVTPL